MIPKITSKVWRAGEVEQKGSKLNCCRGDAWASVTLNYNNDIIIIIIIIIVILANLLLKLEVKNKHR